MKCHTFLLLLVVCAAANPAVAQWHRHGAIDEVVTLRTLRQWAARYGTENVAVDANGIVFVANPYDHAGSARVARYDVLAVRVPLVGGRETTVTLYALAGIDGDTNAARARDWADTARGAWLDVTHAVAVGAAATILFIVTLLALIAYVVLAPRQLKTTSLCREVERRFLVGSRS